MTMDAVPIPNGFESGSPVPATMLAWSQSHYGAPEVVHATKVAVPTPGAGEVLLRVRATSLNSADVKVMRGEPRLVRLAFGMQRPRRAVRGHDVAGTVVRVAAAAGAGTEAGEGIGDETTKFSVGDEVVAELDGGGLAEYVIASTSRLVHRPVLLNPAVAAALPMAGGTAWQALDHAGVGAGQRVLIMGASGGVGTFAVQLARLRGAEVWATCGQRSRDLVESIGASHTFDYREVGIDSPALSTDATGGGFDAIVDIAGTAPLRGMRRLVRPGGTVVLVSGEGGRVLGPLPRIAAASILSIRSSRPMRMLAATPQSPILTELVSLTAEGSLTPVIERTWPLDEARCALEHVDSGRTVGKVIVTTVVT